MLVGETGAESKRWLAVVLAAITLSFCVGTFSSAQALPAKPTNYEDHIDQADLWINTVFGHCFASVTGNPIEGFPGERQGEWSDLRPDYASTLLRPLYNPKQSSEPFAIILDKSEEGDSCWSQYNSLVPDYATTQFNEVMNRLVAEDRIRQAVVDQGLGPQMVGVILAGDDRVPVIFYQNVEADERTLQVVTIVQKTVDNFVYQDVNE